MAWSYDSYLPVVTRRESGGNPNAKNPRSSASGLFQIIDPTYMAYAQRLNPRVSEAALMAQKNDPAMQNAVMRAFTEDNVKSLQGAGINPTNGSVYAAHFLGPQGAIKALTADDNAPINQVIGASALKANPSVFGNMRTVADFKRWADQYNGDSGNSGAPMQIAMGQHTSDTDYSQADLPAEGAQETGFQPPAGSAQPQSTWDKFLSGGPGALFGHPQEGWNAGDALMGAGAALMARDNPSGAAALAAALRYSKDGKTKTAKQVVRQDAKSGQVTVYDPDTNSFKTQQVFDRAPEDPKNTDTKYFGENASAADKFAEGVDIFDKHRRRLANNEVDLSVLDRVQQSAKELLNTPLTPAQRNAVELSLDLEKMRNDKLLEAKGVQTEGDADRAMRSIMPGMGKYNPDAVLTALDKGYSATQRMYQRALQNNDALYRRYGDRIGDSEYGNRTQGTLDRWKKSEEEFAPIRENYYKGRGAQAQQAQETITGRPQTTRQGPASAPDFREGQTATNPQTKEKMIFRNGRWEKL